MSEPGPTSAAGRARRQRARLLTLLADWYGDALYAGDARRDTWLEIERMAAEDASTDARGIASLASRFFASPDADLLLEIAAALEARARRIEVLAGAAAASGDEDDDHARAFTPVRTVALAPPLAFAAN